MMQKKPGRRSSAPKAATRTAGVRDMKAHLSAYLRRVREGETVTITDRGEAIAQLVPPPPPPPGDALEQTLARLERAGQIVRPTMTMAQLRAKQRVTASRTAAAPRGTAQRVLDADRDERS